MTELRRLAPASLYAAPDDLDLARSAVVDALPGDPSHEASRADILAFIDAHPDALHRRCLEGHLTASAAVLDPARDSMLLLLHAKVGRWLQPGGHADGDGNLAHVAWREAQEETGIDGLVVVGPAIDLDVHVFHHAAGAEPDHLHLDVRHLVLAPRGATVAINHESRGVRWVPFGELDGVDLDPGTHRMARSARAALMDL